MNGSVAVIAGKVAHVGTREWVLEALAEDGIEYAEYHWEGALLPGLVNAHTHLQYTHMEEVGAVQYGGFWEWSHAFGVVYDSTDPEVAARTQDWGEAAADGCQRSLRAGVTAAADVVTDMPALSALEDAGMHGIAYWEVFDFSNATWAEYGKTSTRAVLGDAWISNLGLSPHAPYSLATNPLLEVPDMARKRNMRIHIHLGEDPAEGEQEPDSSLPRWIMNAEAGTDDDWPSFGSLKAAGRRVSATRFVDRLGLLGPDCHIAHGIYLGADDRARLRLRGTAVALCPRSNKVIGLDEAPVAAYLTEGNRIAVGTDSLSSSPSLDLMSDVAELYRIARSQGYSSDDLPMRLLHAATLGGAEAMGMGSGKTRIGQLSVGAAADLCFLELSSEAATSHSAKKAMFELVTAGGGRCAATVLSGHIVYGEEKLELA
jgi:cytosine/adenosine deaminase-related metal-dependent hydrolase